MRRNLAITTLRGHDAEFRAAGIAALFLAGSTARDGAGDASDVDLFFDVVASDNFSLLSQARLQVRLEDLLGTRVDLIERRQLRPAVARAAGPDLVRIF